MDHEKFSDDDVPSAPPFCGSGGEIKQDMEKSPTSKVEYTSTLAAEGSNLESVSPSISAQENITKGTCNSTVRFVQSIEIMY